MCAACSLTVVDPLTTDLYDRRDSGYFLTVSTMGERQVTELGKLPRAELREVWQRVGLAPADAVAPSGSDERAALEAVHALYGRFAGGNMLVRLLQERARDRER